MADLTMPFISFTLFYLKMIVWAVYKKQQLNLPLVDFSHTLATIHHDCYSCG